MAKTEKATTNGDKLINDRGLPSSVPDEISVLGAILLNNRLLDEAVEFLNREDFYYESHKIIFTKMQGLALNGSPIDLLTLQGALKDSNEFEQIGGATYIAKLGDGVPRADTLKPYALRIREKSMLRMEIHEFANAIELAYDPDENAASIAGGIVAKLSHIVERHTESRWEHVYDVSEGILTKLEQLSGHVDTVTGLATGLTDVDRLTCGLQRQDLIVIAGRPSMGKTALALNIGMNAAKGGASVGVFSLEMSTEQLVMRLQAAEAKVDSHRLRSGYLGREEWARLMDVHRALQHCSLHIVDKPALRPSEMRVKARQLKAGKGLDLLIVDYLQLMNGDGHSVGKRSGRDLTRQEEVSSISRELKALAKELDIPVIALSQLSREPEKRTSHRPQLSDIRESGAIEQDSDVVGFLYREELYKETDDNKGEAELIIAKQRNGLIGTVKLTFRSEFTRFENAWKE